MNWFVRDFNIRACRLAKKFQFENAPNVTLIYGPRGVGKSALLQYLYKKNQSENGLVITDALAFARQYAYAAQERNLNQFRERYRSTRLLLIDDLQCLAGKAKTIEELHYTYEYINNNGGKLVITCEADRLDLGFLGERLASRLLSGVAIPIERPQEFELEAFLEEYVHQKRLFVAKSVLCMISKRIDNLADAVKTIGDYIKFAELHEDELSLACFQAYWYEKERKMLKAPDPINIIRNVAQTMGVSVEDLQSASRKKNVNEVREMAIYAIRSLCHISFPAIASYFNRNHNSIILSYQKMQDKLVKDKELIRIYQSVLNCFDHEETIE
ncbi:DnaA ATPase domain-containing protein [Desulfosporosinus meridiei]|uniref:ATPase involved in DNA replication initiation n=1 Tax=Desulfosporosinus meridiei (strain ATCC BAA-275 / DSM 13257 / KCTC 12902 / NCIMB 13706 / S10) TaxID=768704 RepID=J7IRN4_DESMD|nr:DnaA/Hda family protein [Desulfosporosinus meridiei]AFQ44537.1 ATPase involved in DNA replication initiation [Desulfosporosinus meridiei DSM 13257]